MVYFSYLLFTIGRGDTIYFTNTGIFFISTVYDRQKGDTIYFTNTGSRYVTIVSVARIPLGVGSRVALSDGVGVKMSLCPHL